MNLCHDCNSSYATPGTCNCFAPGGKRYAAPVTITPWPWQPTPTWVPVTPWWQAPTCPSFTVTCDETAPTVARFTVTS